MNLEENDGIKNSQENLASTRSLVYFIFVAGLFASLILSVFFPDTRKYLVDVSILWGVLLLISAITISAQTFIFEKNNKLKTTREKWNYVFTFIGLMLALLLGIQGLMLGILYALYNFFVFIIHFGFIKAFYVAFIASLIFVFGCFFYYFRLKHRALYGVFEVLFSLLFIVHLISNYFENILGISNFLIGIATAGIYIIVRGMDNIQAALIDHKKDTYISKLPLNLIEGLETIFMVEKDKNK